MKKTKKDFSSLSLRKNKKISRQGALQTNKQAWEIAASNFYGVNAMPEWGPFGIGEDINEALIGSVKNKTFVEIACGSGHSIGYLVKHGAKRVHGVDMTHAQIESATQLNRNAIQKGKVKLYEIPMEQKLNIRSIDTVFSIYGIGWTVSPKKLLKNIFGYLSPGGRFVWSWDHTFFTDVEYQKGKFAIKYSYHKEREVFINGWRGSKGAYITYRKTATWFKLLTEAGFRVIGYLEPEPRKATRQSKDRKRYYSIYKAKMIPSTMIFVCEKPS
ncbi:MAG: hypothetical protein UX72_C0022G0004 [Parcubacteria group bacterium GW2011_GWA2_47_10]|nr:MAG: hypothetical protein UX72_C0022G0004 [Parcubacteria group bacterium GW2011_GWA2_47_10]